MIPIVSDPEEQPSLLIVDDDETFCAVMKAAMSRRGFQVTIAHNAESALKTAIALSPEFALIDLKLQGDSGLVLVRQLKALETDIRMVVLTGYASIATAVEAIKLGAIHYLAKPVDADEILAALDKETGNADLDITPIPLSIDRMEWEHIQRILAENEGNISATARSLKMHRRTLQRKLAKHPSPE